MKNAWLLTLCAVFFAFHSGHASSLPSLRMDGDAGSMFAMNRAYLAPTLADNVVGASNDACDGSELVKLEGKDGQKQVPHSTTNFAVDLPGITREFQWYCGGSRERVANDKPFNRVLVTRAKNGAIHWVFLMETAPAPSTAPVVHLDGSGSLVEVGNSKDACDASHVVKIKGSVEPVAVSAGQSKIGDFAQLTREVLWTCGASDERVANDKEFNRVQIERAGNGAIAWVFYRTASLTSTTSGPGSVPAPADIGNFLHNARGTLVVQAPQSNQPIPSIALKQQLDQSWDAKLPDTTSQLKAAVAKAGYGQAQINLSNSSQSEIRLQQLAGTITFKYVVHGNRARLTLDGGAADVTFDAEAVISFARTQNLASFQAGKVTAFVRHVEIEGGNALGTVAIGVLKSRARAIETRIGGFSEDTPQIAKAVNDMIDQVRKSVPVDPKLVSLSLQETRLGDVDVCAFVGAATCQFRAEVGAIPEPQVLGTSNDQCSSGKIWLWDYERGSYVGVSKGQSGIEVEVDNKRFEWYCGDDTSPDPSPANQESASGPTGTYSVRIARDADSRTIRWQFLSWH